MIYNRHSLNKPQLRGCSNIDLVKPPLSGGFIFLLHFSIKSGKIYVTGVIAQLLSEVRSTETIMTERVPRIYNLGL